MAGLKHLSQIPGSLHKLVSDKLARVVQGEQPDVTGKISIQQQSLWKSADCLKYITYIFSPFSLGSTFCQQVSTKAYTDCTQRTTHEELLALLRNLNEDPKHSAKERKRLLRQFYQGHPEIFVQYFGDSVSAVGVQPVSMLSKDHFVHAQVTLYACDSEFNLNKVLIHGHHGTLHTHKY